jgi:hypothetical protein
VGLLDTVSRVLTEYKADISDHVSALKKLKGEEKERAKATIEANEQVSQSLEGQIKSLAKLGLAIGAVYAAGKVAVDAFRASAEHSRLESAASGVSIDKLAQATKGLKKDTELLADAARLNHGAIKLTTEQMAIAEQAMLQYTRQGHDNAKAHDAVLQAVTALKIDGLKDLGVFIDTTGLSMQKESDRGEILRRVFGELTKASSAFANQSLSDAEKIEVSANRVGNAIDRLRRTAGQAITRAAQEVEETATPRGLFNATIGLGWDVGDVGGEDAVGRAEFLEQNVYGPLRIAQQRQADIQTGRSAVGAIGADLFGAFSGPFAPGPTTSKGSAAAKGASDGKAYAEALIASVRASLQVEGNEGAIEGLGFSRGLGLGSAANSNVNILGADFTAQLEGISKGRELTNAWLDDIAQRTNRKSIAETIIGDVPSTVEIATQAFGALKDAMGEAWGAAITGADSFGHALKKSAGMAILGTSKQLFATGVQEGVLGLASLALGPLGGVSAGMHFKASAAAFGGAAITGGLANALGAGGGSGGGGGSYGGGAGAAAPGRSGSSSAEPAQRTVVHIIGDPFDTEMNPRRRLNQAKKIQRQLDSSHYAVDG